MNKNSRIRNAESYLTPIPVGESFHVVRDVTNTSDAFLQKIGFRSLLDGEQVLPRGIGSVSRRNSDGFDIVYRDRPKEPYSVSFMAPGWHNTYHLVTINRWRFPRKHVDGYEIELTLMNKDNKRYVVSPTLTHIATDDSRNKHVLNLFLELFGGFDLMNKDFASVFQELRITKVNWTLLPIGEYPFSRLEREGYLPRSKKTEIAYRHTDETIRRYNPTQCVIGNGGFQGYIAFLFPDRNLTILEHYKLGNATYVFDKGWEELSQKTKAQILHNNLALTRIIHTSGWETTIHELFNNHPAVSM